MPTRTRKELKKYKEPQPIFTVASPNKKEAIPNPKSNIDRNVAVAKALFFAGAI